MACMHGVLRMYRYFKPRQCGTLKCSKEAMELYRSEQGRATAACMFKGGVVLQCPRQTYMLSEPGSGEKLRQLLKAHGNFSQVEMHVKKVHKKLFGKTKSGGWYTKTYLTNVAHWSKHLV